ncbi:uncharacterized protein LOC135197099 [Macrobrachium nipponense]|uniref:uncharacterized protein LOC135197099 n=1 Tax=Macrobrachium nipponense TaxID=159736 RepID=UPI0030C88C9B
MFKTTLLVAAFAAFASAMPEPNMFEDLITAEIQKALQPYDPHTVPAIHNLNVTHDDTSLLFNFEEATFSGFSDIVCTKFNPPILTKKVVLSLMDITADFKAVSYTVEGHLNGQPLSASGAAELVVHGFGVTLTVHLDSYSLSPVSICIAPGTCDLDLSVESLEARFENADELNHELESRAAELVEILQADILQYSEEIVAFLNSKLCHP